MSALALRTSRPFGIMLSSDARDEGWAGALRSSIRREEVVKVRPGVYVDRDTWSGLTPESRYLLRIHAVGFTFARPVFARESAAALHGLPLLRSRLRRIHLVQTTPQGSRRRGDVTVHADPSDPSMITLDGVHVTSVVRTVLDLARVLPHGEALALADAAVRPPAAGGARAVCTPDDLLSALDVSDMRRGAWGAYLVVAEADPLSGSVGESMARSLFLRLGAPRPALQTPLYDDEGLIGYGDFCWPDLGVVGEFDGRLKYGADNPSGLPAEDVVYREKLREDRIRRVTTGFFRMGWSDLDDPTRVAALLTSAGVPLTRAPRWARSQSATSSRSRDVGSTSEPK